MIPWAEPSGRGEVGVVTKVRSMWSPPSQACGTPQPPFCYSPLPLLAPSIETQPPWKLKIQGFTGMGSWHLSAWRSDPKSNISYPCASTLSPLIRRVRFNLALPGVNRMRKHRTGHHHISLCPWWHFPGIFQCIPRDHCQQPNHGVQPLWVCPALQRKGKAKFIIPGN